MAVGEAMIVAGIGARRGVAASEVVALIERAVVEAGIERGELAAIATVAGKAGDPGLVEAARAFNLHLTPVALDAMQGVTGVTQSLHSERRFGVASVSEAAALAAAGPSATLILPRIQSARVTCALAAAARP
jgi:cobalt-precorrin 5A hydrolase